MGYKSLHIMESLSVQCLQVDDVILILSPAVYCGFGRCGSKRFAWCWSVCEVSRTYLLGSLRHGEKHGKGMLITCGWVVLFTNI